MWDEAAELYDQVRPGYPAEIIDQVIETSRLPDEGSILEIGPGTGQITNSFAQRGYAIVAVEQGKKMAELARRNFREFPLVEIAVKIRFLWQ